MARTAKPVVALVYDFDGTLAPGNMQEHQFIPDVGMKRWDFWSEVKDFARKHDADETLVYMHLMLEKARGKLSIRREDFQNKGKDIKLFNGVAEWFSRLNSYSKSRGLGIEHYIISSGNAEIIEGNAIASEFKRIYASRFIFDPSGVAIWPAQAVNYTTKTQYLFRINKGAHVLTDNAKINDFVLPDERPVPFENIIYFGDGSTDIPCFRLVKDLGGLSIAVHKGHDRNARTNAEKLRTDGRVHIIAPADYAEGRKLDRVVKARIDFVADRRA